MNKRLRFFDKDTIPWGNYLLESFYTKLIQLKKNNKLLASGVEGGEFIKVASSNDKEVYAFIRKNPHGQIFVLLNLSPKEQTVQLNGNEFPGQYTELFTGKSKEWKSGEKVKLNPWQYFVYEAE
jgi:glycosidase